jgi:hypothetical protein
VNPASFFIEIKDAISGVVCTLKATLIVRKDDLKVRSAFFFAATAFLASLIAALRAGVSVGIS